MPLTWIQAGETGRISKISGSPDMKGHLNDLGFVVGDCVRVLSSCQGNLIVEVKDCRLALSQDLARRVQVSPEAENRAGESCQA